MINNGQIINNKLISLMDRFENLDNMQKNRKKRFTRVKQDLIVKKEMQTENNPDYPEIPRL